MIEIGGFDLGEIGAAESTRLWQRGGYPLSYLAETPGESLRWRKQAISRFVEADLPLLGLNVPAPAMLRFWSMLAHYHGQVWNAAEPARSLGVSEPTVRRYLDYSSSGLLSSSLQPSKRTVWPRLM